MSFFSGRSEATSHETRSRQAGPAVPMVLNCQTFRVIVHEDERTLKVRLDTRDVAKLNTKLGDVVTIETA